MPDCDAIPDPHPSEIAVAALPSQQFARVFNNEHLNTLFAGDILVQSDHMEVIDPSSFTYPSLMLETLLTPH